ncbi:MAG TPA: OB-fold domain-containing protein [Candidatus Binatia bacterium]
MGSIGISAHGAYVPKARLPRELIAGEWGGFSMGGEKAVASHDEDSLTLAVGAALNCFAAGEVPDLDGVLFASTTSPYREKQVAATLAAVLDCREEIRTADVTDSLRAATTALLAAIDQVKAGARKVLVAAGDCRTPEPDSMNEQSNGDGGAAVVVGRDDVLAEIVETVSLSDEFLGSFRTDEQAYVKSFPGFDLKLGYGRQLAAVLQAILAKTKIEPAALSSVVIAGPNPRAPQGVAKGFGLDAKKQLADTLWGTIGDVGCAQPLLLLSATLEQAKPGDQILVVGVGDGADAILLRATDGVSRFRPQRGVAEQIEVKRTLPSYGKYLRFRRLLKKDAPAQTQSTPVVLFRDRKTLLPLYGGRCKACGTVQYPPHRVCIECSDRSGLEPVKLKRTGKVFTFVVDHVAESPDGPVVSAVIDLDGGGRVLMELTDCSPDEIEIDMPVELTFRRYHDGFGMKNYFWKARPRVP